MFRRGRRERQRKLRDSELALLRSAAIALNDRFPNLERQVNREFLRGKRRSPAIEAWTLLQDAELSEVYGDPRNSDYYLVEQISFGSLKDPGSRALFDLHIIDGRLSQFELYADADRVNPADINVDAIRVKKFESPESDRIRQVFEDLSDEQLAKLKLESVIEVDLDEGKFFAFRNTGDGDHWALDESLTQIYELTHDPLGATLLFESVEAMASALDRSDQLE